MPSNMKSKLAKLTALLIALAGLIFNAGLANAATLSPASVALSNPIPSQTGVTYTMTVSGVSATPIRCIQEQFSTTQTGASHISGFNAAAATVNGSSTLLTSSTGTWNVTPTTDEIQYTNTTNATAPGTTTGATFISQAITNGSTSNLGYWLQFATFSDSSCTTPIDSTTVGFIYNTGSTLSLTVNPTLTFTVASITATSACYGSTDATGTSTATTIPFGTVTSASNGVVCQTLSAATNATNGYTVYLAYDHAPENALTQTIGAVTGTNAAPLAFPSSGSLNAQGDYGYNTTGPNESQFTAGTYALASGTNEPIASETAPDTSDSWVVTHQVGIQALTKPGTYTDTIIYTCTPVY